MMRIEDRIRTFQRAVPMIYAYTTPEIRRHDGWTKIGYTEQDVEKRIRQQTQTADVIFEKQWQGTAIFDDGSGDSFRDTDFHAYLRKTGTEQQDGTEWFRISGPDSQARFYDFRGNRGILASVQEPDPYTLRAEQAEAVRKTAAYLERHPAGGEFLWNAKPRFGKTLAVYDLIRKIGAENVLIVTNRPAIANSWYSDYEKFLGTQSGYRFVSETESLKGKALVRSREEYLAERYSKHGDFQCIRFVSLQDLKGSVYFGGTYDKLEDIKNACFDILVIDEAHEGIDTLKTDVAFEKIRRDFTLHLSGTPFRALANEKFPEEAVFHWTYADEQRAKQAWDPSVGTNPYETLPRLNLFTYQMSEIIQEEVKRGIELDGETAEYAFDLNEFFSVRSDGKFQHESSVDRFLDALTTQEKYPFSTPELRDRLKHTFWFLNRVESAKALAKKLREHPVFSEYEIVSAAGDGKLEGTVQETQKAFDRVKKAIREHEKTITLSVGQLTTGVTIPEWSGVLMLCALKSPALYFQAAFRAQNPCLFRGKNGEFFRKENAYVFDFDPARTLGIFETFANDLSAGTSGGHGDSEMRKANVRELLNFFPVIGEDENGTMIELDAEKVLSIPRKIRSLEVVRRGFMCDLLFQNIHHVFQAPPEVLEIISSFTPCREKETKEAITPTTAGELSLNERGEVEIPGEVVIGLAGELFGEKIYRTAAEDLAKELEKIEPGVLHEKEGTDRLKKTFQNTVVMPILEAVGEAYGKEMRPSDRKQLERKLKEDSERFVEKKLVERKIEQGTLEVEFQKQMENAQGDPQKEKTARELFEEKVAEANRNFQKELAREAEEQIQTFAQDAIHTMETKKRERKKEEIEVSIRDRLRGFTRTIPSFLMAYGTDGVTLATFDSIIPDEVFREVTSISLEQFRFLRDGGWYSDPETGEEKYFPGQLFEPTVFDDSIREFMRLRKELANYFDEENEKDIFDYIPPQKTNQIFTPKRIVKQMADLLETEEPGCFDDPEKTFIDPYMKSGLFISEIVKRLYRSAKMMEIFPDPQTRLAHIFEKQVYGLAPTAIIYEIAKNFLLGPDGHSDFRHNFRQADALEAAKEGRLEALLDESFGEGKI
ncbi:MAG: DEAD/DEAH box helicase family protein [Thermoguttaceae bacterium]|nr:DEAD/DEAH box helicase family protein [Thermoguttaceae bacterium]